MLTSIDAKLWCKMLVSGANNLDNNKSLVDSLNVFPVPDGDTGTNMSLTFMNAAREFVSGDFDTVGEVTKTLASQTLRGARGNSGVILSQICSGFSKSLAGKKNMGAKDLALALKSASDTAYRAVMKPTEGTILTVVKSMSEAALGAKCGSDLTKNFAYVYEEGMKSLENTPNLLPQLKQAGVVDSGAKGLMVIFEGMLHTLRTGEVIAGSEEIKPVQNYEFDTIALEDIKFAYCTEFIINKQSVGVDSVAKFKSKISPKGDCVVVIDDIDLIKVHIHTNNPGYVLERAVELGELEKIKIENMKEQNRAAAGVKKAPAPQKEYGIIAVSPGDGVDALFYDMGVDVIIKGGQTMNPSTQDILKAVGEVNAKNVFVLPNNKNIVLAANQAAALAGTNVLVIGAKSVPQGLAAALAFGADKTLEENTTAMEKALQKVKTGQVTYAVRDTVVDGREIKEGQFLGLADGKIVENGADRKAVCLALCRHMTDEDSEAVTIIYGANASADEAQAIAGELEESFADCDFMVHDGKQEVYSYIISVESL